jgi:hypothetical protein
MFETKQAALFKKLTSKRHQVLKTASHQHKYPALSPGNQIKGTPNSATNPPQVWPPARSINSLRKPHASLNATP